MTKDNIYNILEDAEVKERFDYLCRTPSVSRESLEKELKPGEKLDVLEELSEIKRLPNESERMFFKRIVLARKENKKCIK